MQEPLKLLGSRIRDRRKQLELTQEQVAEHAKLHWTFISGVERGVHNISISNLAAIAQCLQVKVADLVQDF